jgi:hypothetical protein
MKHRNPPRIATWLLNRLSGCDEALIGDMIEEYRRGHSRLWYWRQTSIAVLRTTVADVRSHPVLALRAFVLMVVCVLCYQYCMIPPFDILTRDLIWKLNPRLLYPEHFTLFTFSYHFFVLQALAPCMGYVIGARIVARLHRSHQAAFTLFNAALVLFVNNALELLWSISHNPRHLRWFSSYVFYFVPLFLLFAMSTLVGGLWKLKSRKPAQA